MIRIAGISAGLTPQSRSSALLKAHLDVLTEHHNVSLQHIDIATIATEFGSAGSLKELGDHAAEAYHQVLDADALIISVPVYKTSYPGLFKHFFDLLDQTALKGKLALISSSGPTLYSAILDQQLRPLLDYFGLYTLPIDTYLPDIEFAVQPFQGYSIQNDEALVRIRFATQQLLSLTQSKTGKAA